jgi:hypothetical protein
MPQFASWNKTELLELLLPNLTNDQLNAQCPDGKTALHWAVEMAACGSIKVLVTAGVKKDLEDGRGRTVATILDAAEPSGIIARLQKALAGSTAESAAASPPAPPAGEQQ